MNSDVLIIGGGVIGLSIARELHKSGVKRVTVVERGTCGQEASWAAAGMLGPQAEADDAGPFFELCCRSRDMYPALAEDVLNETGIDIELDRTGTLSLALNAEDGQDLLTRYKWQKAAGLDVELLSDEEVAKAEPCLRAGIHFGLYFPNDWQVENRKLMAALRRSAELRGIEVLENTSVDGLMVENGRVTGAVTGKGKIEADRTVLAAGAWSSLLNISTQPLPFKVVPVRGQMLCFQPNQYWRLWHIIYSRRGYIVPRKDGRVLAGSTTEHVGFDNDPTTSGKDTLMNVAHEIAPLLGDPIDHWSGLRPFAIDGMPVLGTLAGLDGLFVATGHYRNGILLAPVTASIAAKSIVDRIEDDAIIAFGPERAALAVGIA